MTDEYSNMPGSSSTREVEKREKKDTPTALRRLYRPWAFFGFDLSLTWGPLWLLVAGQQLGWFEESFFLIALAGGSAALSAVLFVHTTRVPGSGRPAREFIKDFWIRAVDPRRIGMIFWPVILLLPVLINIVAILFSILGEGGPEQFRLSEEFISAPLGFLAFMLIFGPIPEEIGWRGYGLDALRTRMNLLNTSLVLGVIWALWHLPLVFVEGSFQQGLSQYMPSLIGYFIAFIPASIIMSWIYYRTNRSTLSAILFHFAGNTAGEIFHLSLETRVIQTAITAVIAVIILIAEWPLFRQRRAEHRNYQFGPETGSPGNGKTEAGTSSHQSEKLYRNFPSSLGEAIQRKKY
jgi:uncharacterized protein